MVSFLHSRPLGVYPMRISSRTTKKVIDDMKVRLSYGTVGNAEIGDYASMARYENKRLPFWQGYDDDRYVEKYGKSGFTLGEIQTT